MTTPERLKRRQLIEGAILILLAIFTVAQGIYFNVEDREQREELARAEAAQRACFEEKFHELSQALEVRSELQNRETAAMKRIHLTYAEAAGLIKDDPTAELKPRDQDRLQRKLVEALLDYEKIINDIEKSREENPLPPYPVGVCDQ